jgi:hypothetical protein
MLKTDSIGHAKSPGFKVNDEQPVRIKDRIIGMKVIFMLPPRLPFRGKFTHSVFHQCIKGYCRIQVTKTKNLSLVSIVLFLHRESTISDTQHDTWKI